ncbi:MAG: glycerophosphodiester phosphodiesterase [Clostridiales bacterium]|jgi:glycerophosphoryl diester phosphodiesterase|nr:glycerophosphodiester phosphodiesterase [Clostridiales bacterium]
MARQIKIWGHRGASGSAPENTLAAFRLAYEQGADGVELDVQLTKDGRVVVIHDEEVSRTSNGQGMVRDFTLAQLKQLNFNKDQSPPAEIPELAEVFSLLKHTGLVINVELKTGLFRYEGIEEKVLAEARAWGVEDRVVYSSFNHYSAQKIKALDARARTALLCGGGTYVTARSCLAIGAEALHVDLTGLRQEVTEDCRANGVKLRVWTANTAADFEAAARAEADTIITNYPALAPM